MRGNIIYLPVRYPKGFKASNSLGNPGQHELQKKILKDALLLLAGTAYPGQMTEREYPEYQTA